MTHQFTLLRFVNISIVLWHYTNTRWTLSLYDMSIGATTVLGLTCGDHSIFNNGPKDHTGISKRTCNPDFYVFR